MSQDSQSLAARLRERFPDAAVTITGARDEVTLELAADQWLDSARALRDDFGFEQLTDLAGIDYLGWGVDEWDTNASSEGFSRGVEGNGPGRFKWGQAPSGAAAAPERRFAAVVHLISYQHNQRLRLRAFAADDSLPVLDSLTGIWAGANWFEREAFDLYGIVFRGHPDLRRLLTDYGFIGHPFRKDFPLIGNVEVRYDAQKQRVVYEPVSIEPRVLVPRVIRDDSRYETAADEAAARQPAAGEVKQ
ncbi:NADH-quinone oxidoreductase subunit C [Lysobacter sp. GX 14042]|uniref:NADH-quinone oxidoreductase subunit C n=1 Tax=Lysobacter sp. GX 14042 TaxID=2907155 RepID=UPI001F44391D|nr:NADH-quinone oxidoreductase subunit C [Lysobacter sp. GX 14042]MCE7031599.1 NADH-quinone oxidoreductase subunit C [Lysobacter sp. GX 14042]